jgi:hypothetical protein
VHIVAPEHFVEAQEIGDLIKQGNPVIVNLQLSDNELGRRMIDFCSGLTYALGGLDGARRRSRLLADAVERRGHRRGALAPSRAGPVPAVVGAFSTPGRRASRAHLLRRVHGGVHYARSRSGAFCSSTNHEEEAPAWHCG